jgi:hypothetical protein
MKRTIGKAAVICVIAASFKFEIALSWVLRPDCFFFTGYFETLSVKMNTVVTTAGRCSDVNLLILVPLGLALMWGSNRAHSLPNHALVFLVPLGAYLASWVLFGVWVGLAVEPITGGFYWAQHILQPLLSLGIIAAIFMTIRIYVSRRYQWLSVTYYLGLVAATIYSSLLYHVLVHAVGLSHCDD